MKRQTYLDCARGAAMVFVIMGHIDCGPTQFENWFYSFSLPLFILISGILMRGSFQLPPKVWIIKHARSLLYPYVTFSLFRVFQKMGYQHPVPEALESLLKGATFGGEGVLWYLPTLFLAQLVVYGIFRLQKRYLIILPVLQTVLFSALIAARYDGLDAMTWYFLNLWNRTCIMAVFLFAGCFWNDWKERLKTGTACLVSVCILAGTFVLTPFVGKPDLIYSVIGNPFVYYGESLANSLSLLILFHALPVLCPKWLAWTGRNSLIIYLTHTTFWLTGWAGDLVKGTGIQNPYAVMILATVLVLAAEVPVVTIMKRWLPWLYRFDVRRRAAQ